MNRLFIAFVLFVSSSFNNTAIANNYQKTLLTPAQVQEDLDQWLTFLQETHPDLSYRIKDVAAFKANVEKLKVNTKEPITVHEFWKRVSVFNSVLRDGHTVINFPKMKTMANAHINEGGALFPFKVFFQGHDLFIKANANDTASNLAGSQITHINRVPIDNFIEPLLKRINGDSDTFRRALLERRFAEYVWLYYGESSEFSIKFIKSGVSIADTFKASRATFNVDDVFEDEFKFEFLDEKNALLTINTFSWGAEYKEVVNFLQNVFQRLQTSSVEHLIIDIRENGGGDDVIWIDGILPYIADKKWRTGGDFRVRMLAGREQDGYKAGDVVDGENSFKDYYPEKEKFKGDVSVLISKFTYSSSILFANVIQDFGFGELVGESTGGMTNQTGGTQAISLKHSKLRAIVPFFYLKRPKGAEDFQTVQPDIEIAYDKTKPYELVDKLINYRSTNNNISE